MKIRRVTARLMLAAVAVVSSACTTAFAQWGLPDYGSRPGGPDYPRTRPGYGREFELFEWRGRVDREVHIVMRGRDVSVRPAAGERGQGRVHVSSALPRQSAEVLVRVERGRGVADVLQEPSARNNYTTIVRVRDPRAGADDYRLTVYWRDDCRPYDDRVNRGPGRGRGADPCSYGYPGAPGGRRGGGGNPGTPGTGYPGGGYPGIPGGVTQHGSVRWSGNVDDLVEVRISGHQATYVTLRGNATTNVQTRWTGQPLPRSNVAVQAKPTLARGTVSVVQEPSAQNNYTAVIRVSDPRSGPGYYDFEVNW